MEEAQATTDGTTRALPQPFFVIATQNPIEYRGTYPLPEAQMDRFLMRISMGYPRREEEIEMLERHLEAGAPPEASRNGSTSGNSTSGNSANGAIGALNGVVPAGAGVSSDNGGEATTSQSAALLESVGEVLSAEDTRALQRDRMRVWVSPAVREYIVAITHGTREGFNVTLGVSPRGSLALQRAAQATALLAGREFATPDDVKKMALPVLSHRLIMQGHEGRDHSAAESLLQRLLDETPVPRGHNES
jgi:MoxR-like ATPase